MMQTGLNLGNASTLGRALALSICSATSAVAFSADVQFVAGAVQPQFLSGNPAPQHAGTHNTC